MAPTFTVLGHGLIAWLSTSITEKGRIANQASIGPPDAGAVTGDRENNCTGLVERWGRGEGTCQFREPRRKQCLQWWHLQRGRRVYDRRALNRRGT